MKTFLLFHIIGYESEKDNKLTNRVDVKLVDTNYEFALSRAKEMFDRKLWIPIEVTEFESKK